MSKNIYCGIKDLPKNSVRGSMQECMGKKQVRYYGVEKIDPQYLVIQKPSNHPNKRGSSFWGLPPKTRKKRTNTKSKKKK